MILCLKYNKVMNDAIKKFRMVSNAETKVADLSNFKEKIDTLSFEEVSNFLSSQQPFNKILLGDVFWPTGQNICRWCKENNTKSYFLQHGQWIYTKNKQNPEFVPDYTLVFGTNIRDEITLWPYGKKSKIEVVGNPRYIGAFTDDILVDDNSIYFSPPVILETNPSARSIPHEENIDIIRKLRGIDELFKIVIQPHYRESKQSVHALKDMFRSAIFVDSNEDPLYIMSQCAKVLTHRNSTSVLDSIACRKPVVLTNFIGNDSSYYKRGYFEDFAAESDNIKICIRNLSSFQGCINGNYYDKARPFIDLSNSGVSPIDKISSIMES